VDEWFKSHAWKACVGLSPPRVRIPPAPPKMSLRASKDVSPDTLKAPFSLGKRGFFVSGRPRTYPVIQASLGVWVSALLTLPPKNVFLAECLNSRKENGNDQNGKSAIHARIQARSRATGRRRSEHCGSSTHTGSGRSDAVQLGQGAALGPAQGAGATGAGGTSPLKMPPVPQKMTLERVCTPLHTGSQYISLYAIAKEIVDLQRKKAARCMFLAAFVTGYGAGVY
jgi:hypothetical protein